MPNPAPRYRLPLTSDHYTDIGHVAAYWSRVEHCIQTIVWRLLKIRADAGRHSTASLRPDTHLDLITVLCECGLAPSDDFRSGALELVRRVKELRGERNEIVHGPWRRGRDAPEVIKLKSKGVEPELVPYTIEEIRAIRDRVIVLSDDLMEFLVAYEFHR